MQAGKNSGCPSEGKKWSSWTRHGSCGGWESWCAARAIGFADVENAVPCSRETRMRIASVSKAITMLAAARLWENGKLDLDAPVQRYVPTFPQKTVDGKPVTITTRQLVSHLAGIRHYSKINKEEGKKEASAAEMATSGKTSSRKEKGSDQVPTTKGKENSLTKGKESTLTYSAGEYALSEYHIKDEFDSVEKSLKLFADDDLMHAPGSKYLYSTHGWTLVSAVVEGASGEKFLSHLSKMLKQLGLRYITPEYTRPLISGRARWVHFLLQTLKSGVCCQSSRVTLSSQIYLTSLERLCLSMTLEITKFSSHKQ